MGPPIFPASATKSTANFRSRTPVNGVVAHLHVESPASRGGSTPRPRNSQTTMRSKFVSSSSHRSSMSSFASELDEKFRINDENISQQQLQNDPGIIQAITQTMIGEYLWKYTRTATKSGLSTNRHRRFSGYIRTEGHCIGENRILQLPENKSLGLNQYQLSLFV
ncbi:hypothetical protein BGX38DRAFT_210827 [Terfezia claveryi]|nr:hypothetical protein BGX38DRAFT_210827 [Terfezia claveryi]